MVKRFVEGWGGHARPLQPARASRPGAKKRREESRRGTHDCVRHATMLLALAAAVFSGCAHKTHARRPAPPAAPAPAPKIGDTETGLASWYGHPYHGRPAANGEIYDMETMVAAHRTLPFNTWVRVVNSINSKSVDVRIIDRGPFVDGRMIDLSHAAARAIDLIGPGVATGAAGGDPPAGDRAAGRLRGAGGGVPRPRERRARARCDGRPLRRSPRGAARRAIPDLGGCWWARRRPTDAAGALAERIHDRNG